MKITMYELLGLVKDGKAPKKIAYNDIELEYDKDTKDYYPYYGKYLFEYKFADCVDFLNDEVEIIEEPKKIEKLEPVRGSDLADLTSKNVALKNNSLIELCKTLKNMNNKINELIDEINNLKENKYEI